MRSLPGHKAAASATAAHLSVVPPATSRRPDLSTPEARLAYFCDGLERRELAPRTIKKYREEVANAEWWCVTKGYSLRNVPAVVLGEYVAVRPKSYATRNAMRAAFTHYWQILKRKDPPLWMVKIPRKPRMVCKALTDEEAARLAAVAKARGDRPGLVVLLALYQAFRREDIATMRWDDLRDDGWLAVHGKGDMPAQLPLHPVVKAALDTLERTDETWVFPGRRGVRPHASVSTIWDWVRTVSAEAGLGHVAPHRLRHTCLATANDRSGDLRATMDFARHSKIETTVGYTRTTERRLRAILAALSYEPGAATRYESEQRVAGRLADLSSEDLAWIEGAVIELAGDAG